jgi:hypothetical protein
VLYRRNAMANEVKPKKIMTIPLPQILDEIEDSITLANEAAMDARQAAEEARRAGEKAAEAVKKAAEAAVSKVRDEALKSIEALGIKVDAELNVLKEKATREALALDKAFSALREKHVSDSPFMQQKK